MFGGGTGGVWCCMGVCGGGIGGGAPYMEAGGGADDMYGGGAG